MNVLYWVAGAASWTYIDASFKIHARIDQVPLAGQSFYWWQTPCKTGLATTWRNAKYAVEQELGRSAGRAPDQLENIQPCDPRWHQRDAEPPARIEHEYR